ncbi:MAG: hypothetical protein J0G30_05220 [Actinomycetales bacterium]|nr:hypothetical protein [Actinomycetales bacterium]
MDHVDETRAMDHVDETRALESVIDRLAQQYAPIPRAEIAAIVRHEVDKFSGAPIRDHIPALVEHAVHEVLAPISLV